MTDKGPGRPKADIDWKKVDELLIAGCSGAQVASFFGIDKQTIYDRCVTDNGIPFSQYSQQKAEKGESILQAHQYAKALGLTDKGDNTLLIWLGKTRLKQKEHTDIKNEERDSKIDELLDSLRKKDINATQPETNTELSGSESPV